MASKRHWYWWFTFVSLRELAATWIWSYWPLYGAPIVTAALGYFGGYSPALIFLFCLGAFAMVALGLNQISQWQTARSTENKVVLGEPILGIKPNENKGEFPAIIGMKLGISVISQAQFPLEVEIEELETQIGDRVPIKAFFKRTVSISIRGGGHFQNAMINIAGDVKANKSLLGQIKAKIRYGRPGNLKYEAQRSIYLALKFDESGNLEAIEKSMTELSVE